MALSLCTMGRDKLSKRREATWLASESLIQATIKEFPASGNTGLLTISVDVNSGGVRVEMNRVLDTNIALHLEEEQ